MADAADSKSAGGNPVRVQIPPPAPIRINVNYQGAAFLYLFAEVIIFLSC